jgi:uncharacterized protein YjiS (DUF1127 family)
MSKPQRAAAPAESPARAALARVVAALAEANAARDVFAGPIRRLEAEIAAEPAARQRLAALDAAGAEALEAWAVAGSGSPPVGDPPACDPAERRDAEAALGRAEASAGVARAALARLAGQAAEAASRAADAAAAISPAVAAVLREDGARLAADYWRAWAEMERLRRELAALDQVLLTDFPVIHPETRRALATWLSPEKLPAREARLAADAALAAVIPFDAALTAWRTRAAQLLGCQFTE